MLIFAPSKLNRGRRWTPQASYFYAPNNKQTIQTAPGVVADNAHKGIAIETLTARSVVFHFMSKYQSYEKLRKGSGLPEENKRGRGEDDGLIGQLLLHRYAL